MWRVAVFSGVCPLLGNALQPAVSSPSAFAWGKNASELDFPERWPKDCRSRADGSLPDGCGITGQAGGEVIITYEFPQTHVVDAVLSDSRLPFSVAASQDCKTWSAPEYLNGTKLGGCRSGESGRPCGAPMTYQIGSAEAVGAKARCFRLHWDSTQADEGFHAALISRSEWCPWLAELFVRAMLVVDLEEEEASYVLQARISSLVTFCQIHLTRECGPAAELSCSLVFIAATKARLGQQCHRNYLGWQEEAVDSPPDPRLSFKQLMMQPWPVFGLAFLVTMLSPTAHTVVLSVLRRAGIWSMTPAARLQHVYTFLNKGELQYLCVRLSGLFWFGTFWRKRDGGEGV
eukprot:TRINITY_DN21390_c0_g1_i4.p1 TRINITY_DN21390_c0_g1~~TRINITY_DN21390_c0_g1_i4.p1  ORF type:complete len:364 (-),score=38.17 TRINITY_DN21390_c0_g1_i4:369-1406(-)